MQKELIELVKEKYNIIINGITDEEEKEVSPLEELYDKVNDCINNLENFKLFDLASVKDFFKDDNEYNKLCVYQKFVNNKYFPLNKNQKKEIKNILIKIHTILLTLIRSLKKKYYDLIKNNIYLKILVNLRKKLMSNSKLSQDDYNFLCKYINDGVNDKTITEEKASELFLYLSSITIKGKLSEKKDDTVNSNHLNEEDLIELFSSFNYDFNDFASSKYVILNYGNYDNIKDILTFFKDNNIKLNIAHDARKLAHIFALSKKDTISIIINNIIEDSEENKESLGYVFNLYLKNPSIFFTNSKTIINLCGKKIFVPASFHDYLHNRLLLKNNGISVIASMKKNPTFFTISRNKVDDNLRKFRLYNLPEELYFKTLSSFASTDPLAVIDQFIEVGCLDYLKDNLSILTKDCKNLLFYRIKNLKLRGKTNDDLYRKYQTKSESSKISFIGDITGANSNFIKDDNKEMIIGEVTPSFNPLYDEIIDKSPNCGPFVKCFDSKFIIELEKFKKSEFEYDFNGVIISRYKVLRFYETLLDNNIDDSLDSLMYSICKNSILTKEEYNKLEDVIDYIGKNISVGGRK